MMNGINNLREFGGFTLDAEKRVLWYENEPVNLQLKEIELLCVLTEQSGEVITKEVLLDRVWADSFVEESNLSRHVYRIRKTFKELGASEDLIQTVPRRGYRFTGELTQPGEIVIERHSVNRTLIEEIEGPLSAQPHRLNPRESKTRPTTTIALFASVLLLLVVALGFYANSLSRPETPAVGSIAVLPLRSFDRNNQDGELRLRITDALITKLGNIKEVTVRPTTSVLRFAKEETDALEAGRMLGVDAVLDGRIQTEGENLRVTYQLISVVTGEQIWSQQFDGKINGILDLQDAIAFALAPKLAGDPEKSFQNNPTKDSRAYEKYLQGRFFWNQRTPDSYAKAIRHYEEATKIDPNFALAYSGIADCYVLLNRRNDSSPEETFAAAEAAAKKSIEIDPKLAEGHTSLGLVRSVYRRNWAESEKHFKRAIELNPNYPVAYGWYGMLLSINKRFAEAELQLRKAEKLDPTSRNIAIYLTVNYYNRREFEKAVVQSNKALDLDPRLTTALMYQSAALEQLGRYDDAVKAEIKRQEIVDPTTVSELETSYKRDGIRGFWSKQIDLRIIQPGKYSACGFEKATRYALLKKSDAALNMIEDNFEFGGTCWNSLGVEPAFDSLRDNPRFLKVLGKMDLED